LIVSILFGGLFPGGTTKLSRNSFIDNDLRVFWFLGCAQRCAQFVILHNGYTVILHSKS